MNYHMTPDVLPPASDGPTGPAGLFDWLTDRTPKRFLLPASGLWILALDWLLFPKEAVTLGAAWPGTALIGFLLGSMGIYQLQRRYALDSQAAALFKGVLAGLVVGLPFPLGGTIVGGWVLANSGLAGLKARLFKSILSRK